MISDVLGEAVDEIRDLQETMRCYDGHEKRINAVIAEMEELIDYLDSLPGMPVASDLDKPLLRDVKECERQEVRYRSVCKKKRRVY